ncbi:hypothetical protein [Streptomyces sp. NRRL F-2580]|uniref:hypothetical protein n=1 Tax=Streptomyces sp. NRRL F-2580 TaxID=1463841 RepID=UPI0004CA0FEF|nr:hypothetical protein [Streptomyces sp. NRRL F-2580]
MITEPELDGAWDTAQAAEVAEPLAPRERAAAAATSRPWLWALGGVVVASAVWAGGLYALGDRMAAPALSYRVTKNLCADFKAQSLSGITGDLHKRPVNKEVSHPAVDGATCVLNNVPDYPGDFSVYVNTELHKKTDPATEFGVPSVDDLANVGDPRTEEVPDLGERAVMTAWAGDQGLNLKVLDGGAVFSIRVFATTFAEKDGRPATDANAVQAAMVQDMRELMAALKD